MRVSRNVPDFFVYNRRASSPLVAFSLLASCIGGTATLAMVSLAASAGWPAFWWLGSGACGLAILGLFFAKKIRASRAYTLPEVLTIFLDSRCGLAAALISAASSVAVVAAQFNALGLILSGLTNLDFKLGVTLGAIAIWLYTLIGGQGAVMKSDVWQFILLALSLCAALLWLLATPDHRAAFDRVPVRLANSQIPPIRVAYFLIIFGGSFIIGPMIFGRLLSARSPKTAQKGALFAALGLALSALLVAAVGVALAGVPTFQNSGENILMEACRSLFPPWLSLLLLIGLLAAVVSSADSCLLGAATIISADIAAKPALRHTRAAICLIAFLSLLLVFAGKSVLALLLAASDIFTCGVVAPAIIALCGKRNGSPVFFFGP